MRFGQWFKRTYGYPGKDSSFTSKQIDGEQEKRRQEQADKEKKNKSDIAMTIEERKSKVKKFLHSQKNKS